MLRFATKPRIVAEWQELPFVTALGLGADAWELNSDVVTSPFQRFEWHAAWHAVASSQDRSGAFVLAHSEEDGTIRELLPLARRRKSIGIARARALTWPSEDLGCPDHLDLPLQDAALHSIADQILGLEWDVLMLGNLAESAPRATRLGEQLAKRGCRIRASVAESCPGMELPGSWDEYLAGQSATRRQTIRRKERKLARTYEVVVRDHSGATFDEGWQTLNALHSERWANGTAFTPQVAVLHREFAKSLAARNALWLTTLELNGTPAAAWYGFTEADTVFFFQSGRAAQHEQDSVGQVLMGMMIRRAIERGFRRFDFLRGDEPYKATWTSDRRTTWELFATRPGPRGAWLRFCRTMDDEYRALRKRARKTVDRWSSR
jgi:CelD/BcsL family acetyltransferase involved in cellulose biosynthesis